MAVEREAEREVEETLIQLVDTGRVTRRELGQVALSLFRESGKDYGQREINFALDALDSEGVVGRTGISRDTLVLSGRGEEIAAELNSPDEESTSAENELQ